MDYARFKFWFSAAFALLGGCIAVFGTLTAALPGELQQIDNWLLLLGFVPFSAFMYWVLARGILWIPDLWLPSPVSANSGSSFRVGVTRTSRVVAILVAIVMLFWNIEIDNFGFRWHEILAYPSIGGLAWLAVHAVAWIIEGFRGRATS